MNGERLASDSQRGLTVMWGAGLCQCVAAGCSGAVRGCVVQPLHAVRSHGMFWAPHTGDSGHAPGHRGVHQSLVGPRQGTCHIAKGPPGAKQHNSMGVATGPPGLIAIARWMASRSPPFPRYPPRTARLHTVRTLYAKPSGLPSPVGRHPDHCLLVTAPSAKHNATQHITAQHSTTHCTTHHSTAHHSTQHSTTQHSTSHRSTLHGTSQRTTHHSTSAP